jgi:hypothetical protein
MGGRRKRTSIKKDLKEMGTSWVGVKGEALKRGGCVGLWRLGAAGVVVSSSSSFCVCVFSVVICRYVCTVLAKLQD